MRGDLRAKLFPFLTRSLLPFSPLVQENSMETSSALHEDGGRRTGKERGQKGFGDKQRRRKNSDSEEDEK
jgi:hypothetical protein